MMGGDKAAKAVGKRMLAEDKKTKDVLLRLGEDTLPMKQAHIRAVSDDRRANRAHPVFAEFIKQLTPHEAKALNAIPSPGQQIPLVRLVDKPVNLDLQKSLECNVD
jgi:hypothetical protein